MSACLAVDAINDTSFVRELEALIVKSLTLSLGCAVSKGRRGGSSRILRVADDANRRLNVIAIHSDPADHVSTEATCEPALDEDNSCFVINGYLTLVTMEGTAFEMEQISLAAIKSAMDEDVCVEPKIANLKKVTFLSNVNVFTRDVYGYSEIHGERNDLLYMLFLLLPFMLCFCCCFWAKRKVQKGYTTCEDILVHNCGKDRGANKINGMDGVNGMVVIICQNPSPYKIIKRAIDDTSFMFTRKYGDAPEVFITGQLNLLFPYVPTHLHYIMLEPLKNSMLSSHQSHYRGRRQKRGCCY